MGWFDDIFGGDEKKTEKTSSTSTSSSNVDKLEAQETASVNTSQTASTGKTDQVTTQGTTSQNLSDANRQILDSIIQKAAGVNNVNSQRSSTAVDAQTTVANALAGKVANQGQNLDALIKAQQDAAKLSFAENQGAQISQFADNVGSSMNTTTQLLQQKGDRDLAVMLAGIAADTTLQNRQVDVQESAVAADAATKATQGSLQFDSGTSQAISDALSALSEQKGTVTSELTQGAASQTQESQTATQAIMQELLKNIQSIASTESTSSTGKGSATVGTGGNAGGAIISLLDILSR